MCQVLQRLHRFTSRQWRLRKDLGGSKLNKNTIDNFENMIYYYKRPVSIGELEKIMKEKLGNLCLDLDKPFYLPPLEENSEFIPLLSLKCNLSESPPNISLRIEMFRYLIEEKYKLQGFGFRFETGKSGSKHDYWHVQVTKVVGGPDWIPDTVPCIPVRAKCPVSLIFCMLISFYGKGMYNKIFSGMNIDKKYKEPLKGIL